MILSLLARASTRLNIEVIISKFSKLVSTRDPKTELTKMNTYVSDAMNEPLYLTNSI